MLQDIRAAQNEADTYRLWYQDDDFDLIVWYTADRITLKGFQLCYDKLSDEHSLTWTAQEGFAHNTIETQGSAYEYPQAPILVEDGLFPAGRVLKKFQEASENVDPEIRALVISKIQEARL